MPEINSLKPVLAPAVDHRAKTHLVQPRLVLYDLAYSLCMLMLCIGMWFWHVFVNSEIAVF